MSNTTAASAAVSTSPDAAAAAPAAANPDDSASTITVNTKAPANFPPPKTDKPRPHVCATCQRSFARLEHLKRHERSHTKEKPFECPECARCFARRDLLLRHQQKLHQTSTPSSRPRNRRESASGATPAQSRRKNSVAGVNNAAGANSAAPAPMRPRANTISHVDGAAMQMLAASANASVARGMAHGRHPSLVGLPVHNLDHVFGGMSAVLGHRGLQHGLPKLETSQIGNNDFDASGLRTAPPMAVFNPEFDFDGVFFGPGSTINPNALHYNDSPQSMALDQASPFGQHLNDISSTQPFDDGLDWLTGFEHQMSFNTNENVIDGSSPSAISTTSQSGISDVMVDGSNHPAPAGTSTMWQPSVMGPPQMPNPFAMDLNGSVFPDLLSGAPLSPQPATQKINDPYFSAPPSTSLSSGLNSQPLKNPSLDFHAAPDPRSSLNGGGGNHHASSPVTTITDATRTSIVTILSHCLPFGSRKYSISSIGSPQSPQVPLSGGNSSSSSNQTASAVPSAQDLQRYVKAYLTCFHPHLPFLHLPTLSFDVSPDSIGYSNGAGGNGCLLLSMAAFGAAYEMEHAQSKELFEMAKKIVFFYLEERRKSDVRKADARRTTIGIDSRSQQQQNQAPSSTPLWLVQAMLLNVIYGHTCSDKVTSDIASTHFTALVSLSQSAASMNQATGHSSTQQGDVHMTGRPGWGGQRTNDQQEQNEWLEWKSMEEHKRTVYVIFILSSLAVASYNHSPALTNSEISFDLPCDEEFFAAESGAAFSDKGGVEAANHNRLTFCDALGDLLCTNERQQERQLTMGNHGYQQQFGSSAAASKPDVSPLTDLKPSTFGCLVLIYALHNYIWETRQRHQNRTWTNVETEKMRTHIEPALKAWQVAWSSDPHHCIERPNPFGLGPMSADAIPLLDLAYVKLFVDFGPAKEKLWQRDWDGMIDELSRNCESHDESRSPTSTSESETDPSLNSTSVGFMDSPNAMQHYLNGMSGGDKPFGSDGHQDCNGTGRSISRRERYLRTASYYAVDSLSMSDKLGVSFADRTSHELPMQTALCTVECAQVLAGWITALQDRVGPFIGIIGQDAINFSHVPAIILLEEEDIKLLGKIGDILSTAEVKIGIQLSANNGSDTVLSPDGFNGYAAKILRLAAWMVNKSAVWPVAHIAAHSLETYANHVRLRAEKSVMGFVPMTM
ncbi:hypothetical protein QQS21_009750 [Conoideocrella luteorostrata]|uniref:C2H2-type domain-containing protein n=1 Tax=Conoideocrella luteorostrata TaxID=1105319 RepID=A0AAJ0CGA6_9HYPO|nr:hypothetical protein QQS21_009750 [Conoideocrella luteorostrata]